MKLLVKDITSAVSKVTELVSGEKVVPGVLLRIGNNEMSVCYTDGRKTLCEPIEVESEDGDITGDIVIDYNRLIGALSNCQPSGRIVVDYITFKFEDNKTIKIEAEQKCLISEDGETEEYKVMAVKQMKLNWADVNSNLRTSILGRVDYNSLFELTTYDVWDIEEIIDILSKTSTEKGKVIYMSPLIQKVFVANLAHVTSVPVSQLEVTPLDAETLRVELIEDGKEDEYEEKLRLMGNRLRFPATLTTVAAKQLCGILNKVGKGIKVYTHTENGFFTLVTEDNKVGIMLDMPEGSKAQTSQFDKFSAIKYDSYQMNFVREFIADAVKSAIVSTNAEKLTFSFDRTEAGEVELIITASNSTASINDTYRVITEDCIEMLDDICNRQMKVSLNIFNSMLSQLKSDIISMDLSILADGTACIRLADIDMDTAREEYFGARQRLGLTDIDPTPEEEKVKYRVKTLRTTQYTMIAK